MSEVYHALKTLFVNIKTVLRASMGYFIVTLLSQVRYYVGKSYNICLSRNYRQSERRTYYLIKPV